MPADPIAVHENSVAILGFHDGSAGQVETWFEAASGLHIACFVNETEHPLDIDVEAENRKRATRFFEYPSRDSFKGRPLISALDWITHLVRIGVRRVLPLTPDNRQRLKQMELCREHGIELVSAIHPSVQILAGAAIEPGVWINAGSIVGYKVEIAAGVLVNTGVQLDHHNVLERCCQVDPGVVAAGNVTFRECCHVHTGVTIINRKEIGAGAIVGAGAVVIEDVPAHCTAVGVPAKVIREHGGSRG